MFWFHKMVCERKYRMFALEGPRTFDCMSLRQHYAEVSSNKKTNPKYIKEIRRLLMECSECNESRIDMLKELSPENSEKLLKEYETLNLKV